MDPGFNLQGFGNYALSDALPENYGGPVLSGGSVVVANNEKGNIVIQVFQNPLFTIRLKQFYFTESLTIRFQQEPAQLLSIFALKNKLHYSVHGLGELKLQQYQYALFHAVGTTITAYFEKDKDYQVLEISWSESLVAGTAIYFDILKPFLAQIPSAENFYLSRPGKRAGVSILNVIRQIVNSPLQDTEAAYLFQFTVPEYLLYLLKGLAKQPAKSFRLAQEEWDKIDAIARALKEQPGTKFPIADLATSTGMNTMKLKTAFSERYGCGIYAYQMAAKFEQAYQLFRDQNLSVKEVSYTMGYKNPSGFIKQFIKKFGYGPTDVKKNPE